MKVQDLVGTYSIIGSNQDALEKAYQSFPLPIMLLNIADKDGINSSMTDVFGVAATGLEYIAPRQFMVRFRREF